MSVATRFNLKIPSLEVISPHDPTPNPKLDLPSSGMNTKHQRKVGSPTGLILNAPQRNKRYLIRVSVSAANVPAAQQHADTEVGRHKRRL